MESKHLYLISFGTGSEYRYYAKSAAPVEIKTADDVKAFLKKEFPDAAGMKFIVTPDVKAIPRGDEGKYAAYPELDSVTLKDIEAHLETEHEVKRATKELNSDAPYDDINPDALS